MPRSHLLGRHHHQRDVEVLRLPERRGYADDHDVAPLEHGEVRRRFVSICAKRRDQVAALDIGAVRTADAKGRDPVRISVETGDTKSGAGKLDGQGKADAAPARSR